MQNLINKFNRKLQKNITPFKNQKSKKLIIHCCHHKVGTSWFTNVLNGIAEEYNLQFQACNQNELKKNTDIFLQDHSALDFSTLPPYRGSHLIRDPRDVVISGYFYHLWTSEEWVHIPKEKYGNMSYQQYLKSLDKEQGIIVEMERFFNFPLQDMLAWDYSNPNIIEVKYEDIINNERKVFYEIFKHYEFQEFAINKAISIAEKYSFKQVAKRNIGETKVFSHMRSGKPKEWQTFFSEKHKKYCKKLMGDALIALGYETSYDW